MNRFSYWEYKHFFDFWDFCIVGSGITGLTTAIFLKKQHPNARIAILEKGILPSGASTKNAGFACFGSASEILDDLSIMSESEVFELVHNRFAGLQELRSLLNDKQTGFIPSGGFEIFTESQNALFENCMGKLTYLNRELKNGIGNEIFGLDDSRIETFGFKGVNHLILNRFEGIIDTGLMMKNLIERARSAGIEIFNGVDVQAIDYKNDQPILDTNIGEVKPRMVIVATNGFVPELFPEIDIKPARAQVLITKPILNLKPFGCFHHERGYNYFRSIDNRILLGGGRQLDKETETTSQLGTTETVQAYLGNLLKTVILPNTPYEIDRRWSGIMGIGSSKKVILEKIGPSAILAVRFGGMGIALGTLIGKRAAELTVA